MGQICQKQERFALAEESFEQAILLNDRHINAYQQLISLYLLRSRHRSAIPYLEKLYQLTQDPILVFDLALLCPNLFMNMEELRFWRKRMIQSLRRFIPLPLEKKSVSPLTILSNGYFFLAYQGFNDRYIQTKMATVWKTFLNPPSVTFKPRRCPKLRVGFVSRYFHFHSVMKCYQRLIESLPSYGFETYIFHCGSYTDSVTQSVSQSANHYCQIPIDLDQARKIIMNHQCDVLIYPEIGMYPLTYFLSYFRLAPVQCMLMGHPNTTGIPTIDYALSSQLIEIPDAQKYYSESLVLLDDFAYSYQFPQVTSVTSSREAFGFKDSDIIYYCPMSAMKFHPEFDSMLNGILENDPNGVIVLVQPPWLHDIFYAKFKNTIPTHYQRIKILPYLPYPQYMRLYQLADIVLDTLHFGGGVSSFESIWSGTPVLTLPASYFRARITKAIYSILEWEAFIVDTPAQYVKKAVEIANDPSIRSFFREYINSRINRLVQPELGVQGFVSWLNRV